MLSSKKIKIEDFQRMFKYTGDFPGQFLKNLKRMDTSYRRPDKNEFEEYVLEVVKMINDGLSARSAEENFKAWEKGWEENLLSIDPKAVSVEKLRPKYFRGSKFLRYNKDLIVTRNLDLQYDLFTLARYAIFNKYLSSCDNIYEFGCGSCQNLLMLSEMFPSKKLYGLDWAGPSVKIAGLLSKNRNIKGILFDMLNPSKDVVIDSNSAVVTIHALEQIGNRHEKFISYIMSSRPQIVINYEPILDFYDADNLLDYLALAYSQKRNYLNGFFAALNKLKEEKKIEIIEANRPYLGGVVHEASLIVWKPV